MKWLCIIAVLVGGCAWDPPQYSYVGKSCSVADPCPPPLVCQNRQCAEGGSSGSANSSIGGASAASGSGTSAGTGSSSTGTQGTSGGEGSSSSAGTSSSGGTATSGGATGGSSGGTSGSCGCTPGKSSCQADGGALQLCVAPPDGGCAFTTTVDCADAGLICGAGACVCPPNMSGTFFVDPNQGGHTDGGLASSGLQEPPTCRLRTLTEALTLAGSAAPATVYAIADLSDGGAATFSDTDGGEETFPLILPSNVTLQAFAPAGAPPLAMDLDVGKPGVSCAVTSSGNGGVIQGFRISIEPSAASASAVCCSGGSMSVSGVQAMGPGTASGAANGIDVSGGCQITIGWTSVSVSDFPGDGLCLEASAGAGTTNAALACNSNGRSGVEILGGSLTGPSYLSIVANDNLNDGVDVRGGTLQGGNPNVGALYTSGNCSYGLVVSGASSSVSVNEVEFTGDSASGTLGEVSLTDGTLAATNGTIGPPANQYQGTCVTAAGASGLVLGPSGLTPGGVVVSGGAVGLQLDGAQAAISFGQVSGAGGVGISIGGPGAGSVSIENEMVDGNGCGGIVIAPRASSLAVTLENNTITDNMSYCPNSPPPFPPSPGIWFQQPFSLATFTGNLISSNNGDGLLISAPGTWSVGGSSCTTATFPSGNELQASTGYAGLRVSVSGATVDAEYDIWNHNPPIAGADYAVDAGASTIDATNPCP